MEEHNHPPCEAVQRMTEICHKITKALWGNGRPEDSFAVRLDRLERRARVQNWLLGIIGTGVGSLVFRMIYALIEGRLV